MRKAATLCLLVALASWQAAAGAATDLEALAKAPPGTVYRYGDAPQQFAELGLPAGPGPFPVVVNIHGGCWLSRWGIEHTRSQAQALVRAGFAVWNIEYRRVGDPGGGWPATFADVASAVNRLAPLARELPLDMSRVVLMGHSAGGQLALWLAGRRGERADETGAALAFPVRGVIALTPAPELDKVHASGACGNVVERLMGGSPAAVPARYDAVMPSRRAPLPVPVIVVIGALDHDWGPVGEAYVERARAAGHARIERIELPAAGHFEVVDPASAAWPVVLDATRRISR